MRIYQMYINETATAMWDSIWSIQWVFQCYLVVHFLYPHLYIAMISLNQFMIDRQEATLARRIACSLPTSSGESQTCDGFATLCVSILNGFRIHLPIIIPSPVMSSISSTCLWLRLILNPGNRPSETPLEVVSLWQAWSAHWTLSWQWWQTPQHNGSLEVGIKLGYDMVDTCGCLDSNDCCFLKETWQTQKSKFLWELDVVAIAPGIFRMIALLFAYYSDLQCMLGGCCLWKFFWSEPCAV